MNEKPPTPRKLNKLHEEALELDREAGQAIKDGQASSFQEAVEKITQKEQEKLENISFLSDDLYLGQETPEKLEHLRNLIWQRPTDEEVKILSSRVKKHVEEVKAATEHKPATWIVGWTKHLNLAEITQTQRLVDIGSADKIIRNINSQLILERGGIKEYISVDFAYGDNKELVTREPILGEDIKDEDKIKIQSLKKEALEALHAMPDNYGNVCSMGLDPIVFHLPESWVFAVFAEMKRIVPEGGIIFTDGMYLDDALEKCSPEFKKIKESFGNIFFPTNKEKRDEFLVKYKCKPNDPYSKLNKLVHEDSRFCREGVKYCVDLPEIGFRAYFDEIDSYYPMFLVNVNKTKK